MKIRVIIVNYNTKNFLKACLSSIFKRKWQHNFKICVVDNGSVDGSNQMVKKEFSQVELIETGENLGFSGGNNVALKKKDADYYLLLNSDTEILDGSLDKLVDFIKTNNYGIATCKLLNVDHSLQPNTGDLPFGIGLLSWISGLDDLPLLKSFLPSFHKTLNDFYNGDKQVGWVSGTAMIISKSVVDKIGLLDDKIFMYVEDTDYCIRANKAGFKIGWTDQAEIVHIGGGSSPDPAFRQWLGEFKGLIYLYKKYFGDISAMILKLIFYFFIIIRMAAFFIIGRIGVSKTYGKILFNI